jgi:hypothetical protein
MNHHISLACLGTLLTAPICLADDAATAWGGNPKALSDHPSGSESHYDHYMDSSE